MGIWDILKPVTIEEMQAKRNISGLLRALRGSDIAKRASAAKALCTLNNAKSIDPLIKALDDSNANVREAASDALASFGDPVLNYIAHLRYGHYYVIEVTSSSGNAYHSACDIRIAA